MAFPLSEHEEEVRLNDVYTHEEFEALLSDRSNLETVLVAERRITKWYSTNVSKMVDLLRGLMLNSEECAVGAQSGGKRGLGCFFRVAKGGLRRRLPRGPIVSSPSKCCHTKIKAEVTKLTKGPPLPLKRSVIGLQEGDMVSVSNLDLIRKCFTKYCV